MNSILHSALIALALFTASASADELEDEVAKLNDTYIELREKLYPAARNHLIESQSAWIKYRKAACEFSATINGNRAIFSDCYLSKTKLRIAELEAFVK